MLDSDLAQLYGTETKVLNLAVKRNLERFPADFMFQLTPEEYENLRFQFETSNSANNDGSGSKKRSSGGRRYLPYVFTEQGVAMLSGVLHTERAIKMNIVIMRVFVEIRRILHEESGWRQQLELIREHINVHGFQINEIIEALGNLLNRQTAQTNWNSRERIGFRTPSA